MKTFSRIVAALVTWLCVVWPVVANRPICTDPDVVPSFVGGLLDGMPKYLAKNFKYPKEAYKSGKCGGDAIVEIVVTQQGSVSDVKCCNVKHPALEQELIRVLKESRWYPATKGGKPVDVRMTLHLMLRPDWMTGEPIPFGLEQIVNDADKCIKALGDMERMPGGNELEQVDRILGEAADVFVSFPRFPINYAMLKGALGDNVKAIETMDSCWRRYHWEPEPEYGRLGPMGFPMRISGYSGRTEIWVALMRAMQHQRNVSDMTEPAYRDAFMLINGRILDNDLRDSPSAKEVQFSEKKMQRLQRDMVNEFMGYNMVTRDMSGWDRITRQYSLDEVSGTLAYASRNGYLNNAQVEQISRLIKEEYDAMGNGKYATKGTQLKLFGAKAFAIWMLGGDAELAGFLATIRGGQPTKKLLKYLAKLEKRLAANRELLADRGAVLECLTTIAPPAGSDAAAVKRFHARRKAVEKVFPLEWLMK